MQPVTDGKFSFNIDSFYVAASGGQIHRRAALPEIKALYDTGPADTSSASDRPWHWYEAQLLHYGLPPSKVKATAKMRLLKALQEGKLSVPKEHAKIEQDLKKQWKKQADAAKPAATTAAAPKAPRTKTTAPKTGTPVPNTATPATAKAATPKPAPAKRKRAGDDEEKSNQLQTGNIDAEPSEKKPRTKQTARRGGGFAGRTVQAPANIDPEPSEKKPRTKQTARRSGGAERKAAENKANRQTRHGVSSQDDTKNCKHRARAERKAAENKTNRQTRTRRSESPPYEYYDDPMDIDDESDYGRPSPSPSPPRITSTSLGLINGTYEIDCPTVEGEWPGFADPDEFELTVRLNGKEVWGEYKLGMFEGIWYMPQRPYKASTEAIPFQWRGREMSEGQMSFDPSNQGWIQFFGDGKIAGSIRCCGDLAFQGRRVSSDVETADVLRDRWDEYNEREYERERIARWK
ncbi:hypothetical protein N7535_001525 [Penicillium sp. DV-2018c]|nr:hypothetical protein N7461_005230 [Penicillium sp. DV-2018c]KAJ5582905.1 hypothetical protein N7535_001525 [Penicillium sp. DV-2018c]